MILLANKIKVMTIYHYIMLPGAGNRLPAKLCLLQGKSKHFACPHCPANVLQNCHCWKARDGGVGRDSSLLLSWQEKPGALPADTSTLGFCSCCSPVCAKKVFRRLWSLSAMRRAEELQLLLQEGREAELTLERSASKRSR